MPYTGSVVDKPYFRNHWQFHYVTIRRKVTCAAVGLRMCGKVDTTAGRLQPRC